MSSQVEVHSIEALKDFRTALALYAEDALAAIGAVEAEVRKTLVWLQQDRPVYWQEQIKRRREMVATAKTEVFRRKLQKTPDYHPSMSEPLEILKRAEASLQDAEKRLVMVRKWQPVLNEAILEYHGSIQRIKSLSSLDMPRAVSAMVRIIDALEAYLRVTAPSGAGPAAPGGHGQTAYSTTGLATVAEEALDAEPEPEPDKADDDTPTATDEPLSG